MPRTARLAVLYSSLLHGALILAGRYRMSYDAYNHMFFGDHYRMDWWSIWDERWYAGFYVTSYPPLVHQLIGLLSRVVGLDTAFAIMLWVFVALLPMAVFALARVFVQERAAGNAALGAAFLPSVYLTAHIFGQLPTLAGTTVALFGCAALAEFLRSGGRLSLALAVACTSTTMAFHHATLMLLPWLVLAVTAGLLSTGRVMLADLVRRLLPFALLSTVAIVLVIWPFWDWGRGQTLQTPIDHASRHNFLRDPFAPLMFFLPVYGPLLVLVPAALRIARSRRYLGLGLAFGALFLLGLGDTTPLPRWFFGPAWEWLTYDRFALWASLLLLPLIGVLVAVRSRSSRDYGTKLFAALATSSLIVGLVTVFLPLQPGPVDMNEIVKYLQENGHSRWRYLTFGFGDQLARLSTLTEATTIDGSYHTARTLPELRRSGLGQIDTAYWLSYGLAALPPVLEQSGSYGVRWGFVNIPQYVPVLESCGWIKVTTLRGGVQVWENPAAVLPGPAIPPPTNPLKSFSWGTLPILSLLVTLSLGAVRLRPRRAVIVLRGLYSTVAALVPLSLCFLYYRLVGEYVHDRVYLTYDHALFFLSDALVLIAVIIWLVLRLQQGSDAKSTARNHVARRRAPTIILLALFVLASASSFWSVDWRTSLYISLHLWLVFLFVRSLLDMPGSWKPLLLGFCGALSFQIAAGVAGFGLQSTEYLEPMRLNWPGTLDPSVRGAVVVPLPDGTRVLRAYGTLPHPNILGGFVVLCLIGPLGLLLTGRKLNHPALFLFGLGTSLLALTFSRSAWLGLGLVLLILILKSDHLHRRRVGLILLTTFVAFTLTLYPLRDLLQARTTEISSNAERFSFIGRAWLNGEAAQMLMEHPLTGVGVGSFILKLAQRAGEGYIIEPAHNLFLLIGAELGIVGILLLLAAYIAIGRLIVQARGPRQILSSSVLAGLLLIGLFDHYIWTLAPGRIMLGLTAGLAFTSPYWKDDPVA